MNLIIIYGSNGEGSTNDELMFGLPCLVLSLSAGRFLRRRMKSCHFPLFDIDYYGHGSSIQMKKENKYRAVSSIGTFFFTVAIVNSYFHEYFMLWHVRVSIRAMHYRRPL